MGTDEVFDLTGMAWPVSLLRFNEILRRRPAGTVLEVRIRDPRVVESVKTIVQNSDHRITRIDQTDDLFCVSILKAGHVRPTSGSGGGGNE